VLKLLQVYDNAPGLSTLSARSYPSPESGADAIPDTTFYTMTDENGERKDTPDFPAILSRMLPVGHDFVSGASAYPFKTVLQVACVR
jgi:hypothetical protein